MRDIRVENFLERVERQIYTEDSANDIKDELLDHIESLKEDYQEGGLEEDAAISKALLQMGDPKEIGYAFTDYEAMKKRKQIMFFLTASSLVMFVVTFLPSIFSIQAGDLTLDPGDSFTMFPSILNLWFALTLGGLYMGHSVKFLDLDTSPFAIIWPVKERFKWEYLILTVFFLPLVLVFTYIYFYEEGMTRVSVMALWPLLTLSYAVWAFWFKERYRIPKVMILSDGFVIKGRFSSWTSIESYSWTKDFWAKDPDHYKLTLNMFNRQSGQKGLRKTISVHKRQQTYISEFMRSKL